MQRIDCEAQSSRARPALPTTMFEAERLQRISAPASAPRVDGGVGAQKSSQISAWKMKSARSLASKIRSVPNGAVWPGDVDRRARRGPARARTSASRNIRDSWAGSFSARRRGSRPRDDRDRAVVEPAVGAERRADEQHRRESPAGLDDSARARPRPRRAGRPAGAGRRWRRRRGRARERPSGRCRGIAPAGPARASASR